MLADAHRKAAEDIESTILSLQAQPRAARVIIEGAWGAAFQWIAFGCETKYQQHLNSHTRLGRYLRSLDENRLVGSFRPDQASWLVWGRAGSCRRL
jgi:hypothetical protein